MSITNLGTLQTAVESWMERTLTDSLFVEFAAMVTDQLERGVMTPDGRNWIVPPLRCRAMITTDTINTVTDSVSSWLEFERLWFDEDGGGRELLYVPLTQFLRDPRGGAASGDPEIYTIDGNVLRFGPQGSADVEVTYYQRISALAVDADTNAILAAYPRVYLQGCLAQAYGWAGNTADEDRAMLKFSGAVRALNGEKAQGQTGGSALMARPKAIV